jgi:hypothetical protein
MTVITAGKISHGPPLGLDIVLELAGPLDVHARRQRHLAHDALGFLDELDGAVVLSLPPRTENVMV